LEIQQLFGINLDPSVNYQNTMMLQNKNSIKQQQQQQQQQESENKKSGKDLNNKLSKQSITDRQRISSGA